MLYAIYFATGSVQEDGRISSQPSCLICYSEDRRGWLLVFIFTIQT